MKHCHGTGVNYRKRLQWLYFMQELRQFGSGLTNRGYCHFSSVNMSDNTVSHRFMRPKWLLIKSYSCEVCVTCILVHLYSLLLVMMGSRQLLNVSLCSCNSNCCFVLFFCQWLFVCVFFWCCLFCLWGGGGNRTKNIFHRKRNKIWMENKLNKLIITFSGLFWYRRKNLKTFFRSLFSL